MRSPLSLLSRIQSQLSRQDDHTLEITTIFALLDARSFAMPMLRCLPLAFKPPKLPCPTSNPPCPSKPLIGYVTALLSPSYSVASCRWRSEAVPCWNIYLLVGISLYCYVILMHLYTWQRVEGSASRLVFCSTLAALVSVISVLCSRILRSLRGWVIMGTPW